MNAARSLKNSVAALAVGALFTLGLAASPADAALQFPSIGEIDGPALATPFSALRSESVAVNDSNGHILVADSVSGSARVYDFTDASDTTPDTWDGSTTPAGSFGTRVAVAVDNASGDVYVSDSDHAVIDKFTAAGALIAAFGDTTPTADGQLAGTATPAGFFAPGGGGSFGIAVDQSTHDLYVLDAGHQAIDVFDSTGAYQSQINDSAAVSAGLYGGGGSYADGIAVNSATGHVFVSDSWPVQAFEFDSSGAFVKTWDGTGTPAGSFGGGYTSVAVQNSSGDVYVTDTAHQVADAFDSSAAYLGQVTGAPTGSNGGIAIGQSTGNLYVADRGSGSIKVFGPGIVVPDATTNAASAIGKHSATLNGHVDPAGGGDITDCHFEYTDDATFQSQGFTGASTIPCDQATPISSATDVTAGPTGLDPGTAYHFRVLATNAQGTNRGTDQTFTTEPAVDLTTTPADPVGPVSATLNGHVDSNGGGDITDCHFEYTDDATFQSNGFSGASTAPCTPAAPISSPTDVSTDLSGLTPETTYHVRLVATNSDGTTNTDDQPFTTSPAVNLSINPANPIAPASATLNGHVDSNGGGDITDCHFEYTDDATFQSNGFSGAQTAPCAPATPISSAIDVSATISGLTPETTYHVRLVATNGIGTTQTADQPFITTPAVQLSTGSASDTTKTTATLNGTLNPGGAALSSCQFEYTDDATFQAQAYTGAITASCDQSLGSIGSGSADVPVSAGVSGLQAGTLYHFRLKASNSFGATTGQDGTFVTQNPGFGFKSFSFEVQDQNGDPYTQAGGHPFAVETDFDFNLKASLNGDIKPDELVKDLIVSLPPGLIGNPLATPTCTSNVLQNFAGNSNGTCPPSTQLGVLTLTGNYFHTTPFQFATVPVYNIAPQDGLAAQFGLNYTGRVAMIDSTVRAGLDYAIESTAHNISTEVPLTSLKLTLWGVPADPSHDADRDCPGGCSSPAPPLPLFTNPTHCAGPQTVTARTDSWQHVGNFDTTTDTLPANTGCNQLQFDPSLKARPTTNVADSPSGLSADLNMPQTNDPVQLGTAHLRKAVVTLPEGLVINPSSANGLGSCSASDVGLTSAVGDTPVTFTPDAAQCPDAAMLGTAEVDTPLLDHPITGNVYAAKPFDNPFGSLLAIYVTASDHQSGVVVKLAGKVTPDPNTGRLVTTFDENPQQPVGDFKLDFFGGAGGALRTPAVCGNYLTTSEMTPWSAPDSGPPATPHDDWSITQGPNGSCANSPGEEPHSPSFDAGTVSPVAGTFSPFVMHLRREDGSQQFASLTLSPPPGLLGKLAGTPACTEAQIAQAQNRNNPGQGAVEKADPSCPAASQVGTVNVGAGAGPAPYYTTGKVYLAGPYKGSPLSFVIITPATAGPYDLGAVVVRAAIGLDPATAQITATSDPIPSILAGIPLDVRSITLTLDKPNFTLNGTSCDPSAVSGSLLSTLGQPASLSERFQLAECGNLPFKPKFKVGLKGGTLRNGHPAATIVLNERNGDANLGKAQITLPPSMQLDQSHIKAPCTRPQFAADQCPAASIIGSVTATSPLVDYTLSGPVYLRTGDNPLPDVVLDLHGPASQPVRFDVVNKIDTVHARLRATSVTLPDAPVTKAVIHLLGGGKGLLVNNTNLCKQTNRASILLDGQNHKIADSTPTVGVKCPKPHKKHKHHKRHHARHGAR